MSGWDEEHDDEGGDNAQAVVGYYDDDKSQNLKICNLYRHDQKQDSDCSFVLNEEVGQLFPV